MDPLFTGSGEVGAIMGGHDWAKTPLGPSEQWPQSLRTIVRVLLTSRYSMWMGWGPDLAFLYNDAYAHDTLGAKHPWALGRPAREVWAEIWDQLAPRLERVLAHGEATWDEDLLLFLERNGYAEETYHTFSYSPLPDDQGRIAGNFCVVTEGTERVIGERRLALLRDVAARLAQATTEREVCAAVAESLTAEPRDVPFSLLYLFDADGREGRLAAWSGFDTAAPLEARVDLTSPDAPWGLFEAVRGAHIATLTCPTDRPLPHLPWKKPPHQALVVPLSQQGQSTPVGALVAGLNPHRPVDDRVRSFLGLFVGQIAAGLASARAYEEERRRAEALAAIDRAKTAFFSNVSHEFRTPLTLMLGPTQDALASGGTMDREQLETVYRNELRLLKLVNSLLDFSRIEAGRTRATYEPVDFAVLTADLASTFRSAIERGGLRLDADCAPLPEAIYLDRQMWEKIVLNLMSNAFKFTFDGHIRVRTAWRDGAAVLTVEDTGVGIPREELPRVFERFHRIEGTRARTHEGSGIGLALVRDLVKLHGGDIAVESEPGRGTVFIVTIPSGRAHLDPLQIGSAAPANSPAIGTQAFVVEAERWLEHAPDAAAAPELTAAPGAQGRPRIVLADDNADMREYVQRLLGGRWDVEAVGDGRRALAALRRARTDLLITDVMMPELDGFALVATMRADEELREVPVLMLSARAGEEARLEGLQAGADDYLVKPFSARELLARVEMQLLRASIRAVEELQRRQLADVFEQAPAAIAILRGPDHVYELANPAYLALVGQRQLVGKTAREALPELDGQGIFELLDRVFRTGEPYIGKAIRTMIVARAGAPPEECFFDFVYHPVRDAVGEIVGISVVVFEVSELVRARREAEGASRAKDEFLAMLGHELRNPLAPMQTALQLMRLRGDSTLERERIVIERQTRHLVRLVDDLLDVSRIARGKIDLRLERIDIADVVAKAIEMASPLLEEREHDLGVEVPRGLLIDGDPARLAQVVANLLTNAAKYTEKGGVVAVDAHARDGFVVLNVRDSGIGIAPEMLPRVFDMFTQESQALDRRQGGLGLGLTIVRNLTTLHGGTVEAHSDGRNRGSVFTVRLPVAAGTADSASSAAPARISAKAAGRGPSVLVVDDNEDAAAMLADYVKSLGYQVRAAHDGPAALKAAVEAAPDIALLDLGLPVMDGYELAMRLRESGVGASVKLVAITGYGQPADRERTREVGFDAHLVKPVDLDVLAALLDSFSG